ncbi:protein kinase [Vibrio rotiferianus]|uniref:Protein kinase n=2 Tax=Vibrio rotiferianus TaxID=190895 RepID=A0A7Y4E460_9VIBR|nr:protein kinase [Vibrio rotiferianus]
MFKVHWFRFGGRRCSPLNAALGGVESRKIGENMEWDSSWEPVGSIEGGAQGDCFRVKRKGGDDTVFFLKQLKEGGNTERRARFAFEATLHKTFKIDNITNVIETNADLYDDKRVGLYYVAELVPGDRLDKFVQNQQVSESEAIDILRQLLEILVECHKHQIIHRDIKPENIIINSGRVHLVDFGIATTSFADKQTKTGQEIGNRFLRLPEFVAGSANKRDHRSDLTLACGIALYLLSGQYPRVLQGGSGAYPHQEDGASSAIASLQHSVIWNAIFDRAFIPNLLHRWNSSEEILAMLDKTKTESKSDIESLKSELDAYASKFSPEYLRQLASDLSSVYSKAYSMVKSISLENKGAFRIEEQSWVYNHGNEVKKSQIRFHKLGSSHKKAYLSMIVSAELLGEQVIAYLDFDGKKNEIGRFGSGIEPSNIQFDQQDLEALVLKSLVEFTKSA